MQSSALNRILLVEDDPDIHAIAKLALEAVGGFTVGVCSTGREALHFAPCFRPDLILLDVMMPEMDGPTTLKAIRQMPEIAHTPIIFMTAKIQSHERASYLQLGAFGIIDKPFDPMTLSTVVRQIWERQDESTN